MDEKKQVCRLAPGDILTVECLIDAQGVSFLQLRVVGDPRVVEVIGLWAEGLLIRPQTHAFREHEKWTGKPYAPNSSQRTRQETVSEILEQAGMTSGRTKAHFDIFEACMVATNNDTKAAVEIFKQIAEFSNFWTPMNQKRPED